MSITDELREYASIHQPYKSELYNAQCADEITAIADRIDVEHDRAITSVMNDALYHANDKDMAEFGWIRLPKDADGEYIRIGDKLIDEDDKPQKPAIVKCILYNDEGCVVSDIDPRGCWYDPSLLRHYHTPTVEDLLTEFGIDWEHESDCEDRAALLKEYAAKLKLAGR